MGSGYEYTVPLAQYLGEASGEAELFRSGPGYELWRRQYQHGTAIARIRSPWNASVLLDVDLQVPRGWIWVDPEGRKRATVRAVKIHNGGGAVFVYR